ncbi:hypothetical protein HK16_16260 [Acetobacter senegalensis]|uniref:Uncharacterized protein n=2 Tax=Acetobacter TaxID=434 RepID=A0A252EH61_9PROT|nr:hypothetical protein CIW82_17895 [Acetobacter tropicalis]OUL65534.1 hypothetical protein HK16_16260 [Acetobacter senegalensis]
MLNYPQKKRRPKSGRPFPYLMPPRLKTLPIKKQIPPPYIPRGMGSVTPASTLITQRRSRKICDAGVRKDFAEPKKAVFKDPTNHEDKNLQHSATDTPPDQPDGSSKLTDDLFNPLLNTPSSVRRLRVFPVS